MDKKHVSIVYFSGTGGTKRIVDVIDTELSSRKYYVVKYSLDRFDTDIYKEKYIKDIKSGDLLFVIYPVYAFDAPDIIYDWIKCLPVNNNIPTMVLSVSGGGEVWPNTFCRIRCIRALEEKGFDVFYENMMIMPSNCIIKTNDHLSMRLLNAIPYKINKMIDSIEGLERRRVGFRFGRQLSSLLSKLERKYQKNFSSSLRVKQNCIGCGWCADNCPRNNIKIEEGIPTFGETCIVCLRCIYGCPNESIYSNKYNGMIIREGYSIDDIEERMKGIKIQPIEECCKGIIWIGVKKYLKE